MCKTKSMLIVVPIVLFLYCSTLTFGGYLYGIDGSGYLCSISSVDGTYEIISTTSKSSYGLAYNSHDGYLYGMDGSGYLSKISPSDGSYEFVSTNSKGLYG